MQIQSHRHEQWKQNLFDQLDGKLSEGIPHFPFSRLAWQHSRIEISQVRREECPESPNLHHPYMSSYLSTSRTRSFVPSQTCDDFIAPPSSIPTLKEMLYGPL